ncbi:hypothetical protein O3M35_002462 [Rhynocoris fuscipes]|uniref:Uncharacterized protein n=1 Tax=Rhynocoris fuscipes TaxID=488301 RepID=A0AAW1CLY2_9HEMI
MCWPHQILYSSFYMNIINNDVLQLCNLQLNINYNMIYNVQNESNNNDCMNID